MTEPTIDMKPTPSYEEAYRKLHAAYMGRLRDSLEAIDNIVTQRQLRPLTRDDLVRAQYMAHGLAGSGTTFGFPEITAAGQKADSFADKLVKSLAPDKTLGDEDFQELEKLMLALRMTCLEAVHKEENVKPVPSAPRENFRKPQEPFHVLIVDDDEQLGDFLSMKLRQKVMQVTIVNDGSMAMSAIRNNTPDLIVLDISMPGMSGHEVLRQVKQNAEFVSIPILMLTGQADQKDVVSALHSGAIDYILKPFDPEKLVMRIEKILDAARHRVLIADNDPLILQLLESKFRHAGFKVILVDDGKKAWDQIQKTLPDLAILDRMMPGLEGLAVLKNMREEIATKDIPVIILSARKQDQDIEIGLKLGAQKYMTKPFMPDELIAESWALIRKPTGK